MSRQLVTILLKSVLITEPMMDCKLFPILTFDSETSHSINVETHIYHYGLITILWFHVTLRMKERLDGIH